jgi:ferredoxin-NADP reductase
MTYTGTITQFRDVTADIRVITIKIDQPYDYKAGQYTQITLNDSEPRFFSIANAPRRDNTIDIHVRNTGGTVSKTLCTHIRELQSVELSKAMGNLQYDPNHIPAVFIAGGTGITPVLAIIEKHKGKPLNVFWGAKSELEFYAQPKQTGLTMHYCVENFPVQEYLKKPIENAHIYLSGPPAMVHDSKVMLLASGVHPNKIYSDA